MPILNQFWNKQYIAFINSLQNEHPLLAQKIAQKIDTAFYSTPHGKLAIWQTAIEQMQGVDSFEAKIDADKPTVKVNNVADLEQAISIFKPWRKGPFQINDIVIDTEWRSDWKWNRIKNKIIPLNGKRVLDVGCGSGYHCYRMKAEGAELVIGLEPMISYVAQFIWLNAMFKQATVSVLPFTLEQWVNDLYCFDTVFSMGVLYHRRSPIDHLYELKNCLNRGGQLVLETLIISGDNDNLLVPEGRYAQMRNVWFIPTVKHLSNWLQRVGFKDIKVIDINRTTIEEQRATKWMDFDSLEDFLDAEDATKTIEGYESPLRATITAIKK